MHPSNGATRFKRAAIGVFLFAGFLPLIFARARTTSASLKVLGFGTNQYFYTFTVQFSNAGPATICYLGYETNEPLYYFEMLNQTGRPYIQGNESLSGTLRKFELKPRQSVDFQVLTSAYEGYWVTIEYDYPHPTDWVRNHAPPGISRWLSRTKWPTAQTPLMQSNSFAIRAIEQLVFQASKTPLTIPSPGHRLVLAITQTAFTRCTEWATEKISKQRQGKPMNARPRSFPTDRPQVKRAFTLTELLVVVAALALLVTLTAVASTRDQSLRAQCAENLHKLTLTTTIIANDNSDKLPANGPGVNWAWDMSVPVGNTFTLHVPYQTFYCPSSGFTSTDNSNLWIWGATVFHVIGYAQTFPGTGSVASTNLNTTLTPQRILGAPAPLASQRVLFADSVISISAVLPPTPADNFTNIAGGFVKHHRTCHMDGPLPAGGNLAMLDGHVEWRNFSLMVPRSPGAGTPIWWW
jgi:prepilin-type N-terminal cleavage/methylation domain-containing protein/prepilin-type processing-associated H-X9-DG protein